jgi:hypothetical protein
MREGRRARERQRGARSTPPLATLTIWLASLSAVATLHAGLWPFLVRALSVRRLVENGAAASAEPIRVVVVPQITDLQRHPKLLLWKSAAASGAAIKPQKIRDDEQTRVVVRGRMKECTVFATDLRHLHSRNGWIVQEVLENDVSELRALFDEAFITFNADDGCIEVTPDDGKRREGS